MPRAWTARERGADAADAQTNLDGRRGDATRRRRRLTCRAPFAMADQVAAFTGLSAEEAQGYLEMAGGSVEAAVALFFDVRERVPRTGALPSC